MRVPCKLRFPLFLTFMVAAVSACSEGDWFTAPRSGISPAEMLDVALSSEWPEAVASVTASGDRVEEMTVFWAPGDDGVMGTTDDVYTPDWPIKHAGLPSPPGYLWQALGINLAPSSGGLAFTVHVNSCMASHAGGSDSFGGGIEFTFLDPETKEARTTSYVAVEVAGTGLTLTAYDAGGQVLASDSRAGNGILAVEHPGIVRAEVTSSYWCLGHRAWFGVPAVEAEPGAEPAVEAPVADAGEDQVVEATGATTQVSLDGSGSYAPSGKIVSWEWLNADSEVLTTGETAEVGLPLGVHVLTLRVTDDNDQTAEDQVQVTVKDTTAPEVGVSVSPELLLRPDHQYRQITVVVAASDATTAETELEMVATVVSSDLDNARGAGDGNTTGDIRVTRPDGSVLLSSNDSPVVTFDPRTDQLELRAERAAGSGDRLYTILVTVADSSGNEASATAIVTVPLAPAVGLQR